MKGNTLRTKSQEQWNEIESEDKQIQHLNKKLKYCMCEKNE